MSQSNMFRKKPEKESVVEFIVGQIENAIIERELKPGDKLPPSRELQKMLGTSQGTLREALRILEQKGLLEARLGRSGGLYVKAVTSDKISESLALLIRQKQISAEHVSVFRSTLEVSAASLAAIMADASDTAALKKLLNEAEAHLKAGIDSYDAFYEVEDRMHAALATMTQNPLFESVLITVYKNLPGYNKELIPPQVKNMKDSFDDWVQLIQSIENRRPDKAGWIMTRHIQRFLPSPRMTREENRQ